MFIQGSLGVLNLNSIVFMNKSKDKSEKPWVIQFLSVGRCYYEIDYLTEKERDAVYDLILSKLEVLDCRPK